MSLDPQRGILTAENRHVAAATVDGWTYQPEPSAPRIRIYARHIAVATAAGIAFEVAVRQPCRGEEEDHGANAVKHVYLSWRRLYRDLRAGRIAWSKFGSFERGLPKSLAADTPWQTRREFFRSVLAYESQYSPAASDRRAALELLERAMGFDRKAEANAKWGAPTG